jgi:hypothetical protein
MEILPGLVRLIIDFDDVRQMAAFVRWVDQQGRFGSEVDACQVDSANPVTVAAEVAEDHVFRLVPEYRPEYGLSVFSFLPPPAPAEPEPPD